MTMSVSLGEDQPPMLGLGTILGLVPQLVVDGVALTKVEIEQCGRKIENRTILILHSRNSLYRLENYTGENHKRYIKWQV